jgi:predicted phosphodiesterase
MKHEKQQEARRKFIRQVSLASALLIGGKVLNLSAGELYDLKAKARFRFVLASDFHYGQPDTPYEEMANTIIRQINLIHKEEPIDFCILNGDLIHDKGEFLPQIREKADLLQMPYYAVRGNHDMVSDEQWNKVWKTPLNHSFELGEVACILADTSNEKGTYLSPDIDWLGLRLEQYKHKANVFLALHIPQAKWTRHAVAFFDLIRKYPNIRAVFHGHEHDHDGAFMDGKIPFLFDSHAGGSWGTDYRGFRMVELMDNGTLLTYMMNPVSRLGELSY